MFYGLASILFPTLACETSSHFNPLNIYIGNASDTEFRLSVALGNEMNLASLAFLLVNNIYFMLKRLSLKGYAKGAKPKVCFLKLAFLGDLRWQPCK